jgi:hypothetical protein
MNDDMPAEEFADFLDAVFRSYITVLDPEAAISSVLFRIRCRQRNQPHPRRGCCFLRLGRQQLTSPRENSQTVSIDFHTVVCRWFPYHAGAFPF